ncbi:unnamed protein product, partial [Vitis vinifera]
MWLLLYIPNHSLDLLGLYIPLLFMSRARRPDTLPLRSSDTQVEKKVGHNGFHAGATTVHCKHWE